MPFRAMDLRPCIAGALLLFGATQSVAQVELRTLDANEITTGAGTLALPAGEQLFELIAGESSEGAELGFSVAISGDTVVVGAPGIGGSGAAYVFERNTGGPDQWGRLRRLVAVGTTRNDRFGASVAIDGDTIVVGAPEADVPRGAITDRETDVDAGAAFVFKRNTGGADRWGQMRKLVASDRRGGDAFGHAVAIDGDRILVGAPLADAAAEDAGSAYLFERNAEGADRWGEARKLVLPGPVRGDRFGSALAIAADTVIVGASLAGNTGSVTVFERNAGGADTWGAVDTLSPSDGDIGDQFGASVAITQGLIAVGAHLADGAHEDAGAVYVFARDGGVWHELKRLTSPLAGEGDRFGASVSLEGDLLLVGAPFADSGGLDTGVIHVFERNEDGWNAWGQVGQLTATEPQMEARFGAAIGLSGETFVAGAYAFDAAELDGGAAHIGTVKACRWTGAGRLGFTVPEWQARFGGAIDVSGDTVVVGARYDDERLLNSGSVTVFERNARRADDWGETHKLVASDALAGDQFGSAVAIHGDTLVVGQVRSPQGSAPGSVYVFERDAGTAGAWGQIQKLTSPAGASYDDFGAAVAVDRHTVAVGAPEGDDGGVVHVFERNVGGADRWGKLRTLVSPNPARGFGRAVSLDADRVVVGSPAEAGGGAAYLFERNASGPDRWGQVKRLALAGIAADAGFGSAVSISGDTVVITAPRDTAAGILGAAYVFVRNAGGANQWGQVRRIALPQIESVTVQEFGSSVALSGDRLILGSARYDRYGAVQVFERNAGGLDQWGSVQRLEPLDASYGQLGSAVALDGDTAAVGAPSYTGEAFVLRPFAPFVLRLRQRPRGGRRALRRRQRRGSRRMRRGLLGSWDRG